MTRPRLLRAGPDADLGHLPVSLDLRALSVAEGVRAALSVAVIVAANEWIAFPPLNEAALAALLTCLCDAGGPFRRRVPALLPSRPGESHPEPLTDPDLTLSRHPAHATERRLPPSAENWSSSCCQLARSQRR